MTLDKSPDAFKTISEVAEELCIPQHVLRFWETRFTQVKPMKRAGGRRYYRISDIVMLKTIRRLLYEEGYTIKGVQKLLNDKGHYALFASQGGEHLIEEDFAEVANNTSLEVNEDSYHMSELEQNLFPFDSPDEWSLNLSEEDGQSTERTSERSGAASFFNFLKRDTMAVMEELEKDKESQDEQEDNSYYYDPNQLTFDAIITDEKKRQLEDILSELLECKRLLDQAREL